MAKDTTEVEVLNVAPIPVNTVAFGPLNDDKTVWGHVEANGDVTIEVCTDSGIDAYGLDEYKLTEEETARLANLPRR